MESFNLWKSVAILLLSLVTLVEINFNKEIILHVGAKIFVRIIESHPGKCPICGMNLIAVQKNDVLQTDEIKLSDQKKPDGSSYLLTTNIEDALTKGVELYVELSLLKSITKRSTRDDIRIFNCLSYNHARYLDANINKGGTAINVKGYHVENVPDWMNKTGLTLQHNNFTTALQYSYTSKSFNDALNTVSSTDGIYRYYSFLSSMGLVN